MLATTRHYLACDLGAESGRLMVGTVTPDAVSLQEVRRFPNQPIQRGESLFWDLPGLFEELRAGLKQAAGMGLQFSGISTDSWGVDAHLFDESGQLAAPAHHYRDPRSARGVKAVLAKVPWEEIFARTGIQFMPINGLFQLGAETPERLAKAAFTLGVGDAFNFWLCGRAAQEISMASTWQLYDPVARGWAWDLIDRVGFRRDWFPPLVPSGTTLGVLKPEIAADSGLDPGLPVIATCSHDTGAAVAAIPGQGRGWAYLSSGTWSLLGAEIEAPILTPEARELNFTNEIGHGHTVRLLKNIAGLWIVQECRRAWGLEEGGYAELTAAAAAAAPFAHLVNPAAPEFLSPGDMPGKIARYCARTGQPAPATRGAHIRCALESLALAYRRALGELGRLAGRPFDRLHVVGGGSRNELLCQFTSDATGLPLLAGPAEATALGNVLVQAIGLGQLRDLAEGRERVRRSFAPTPFTPGDTAPWEAAWARFQRLPA